MGNIIDYVKEYGKYSFLEMPLNEVDSLVLCQMVYMNYSKFVPGLKERNKPVSIQEICEHPELEHILDDYWYREKNMELFLAAARSARFGTLKMNYYVNVINPDSETQFSAMTYILEDKNVYIAFRGTDATLIGWKEDLNMAFSKPLHSQHLAVEYMERVVSYIAGSFYMGGHSKGGNLAVYAAMNCSEHTKNALLEVYNHDGPGFRPEIRNQKTYEEIVGRVHKFIPKSSVVGMILEDQEDYEILESRSIGLFQHNAYSWKIEDDHFVRAKNMTNRKVIRDAAFNQWILSLTEEEAHAFVDTFYNIVSASQVSNIFEFGAEWKKCLSNILEAAKEIDEDTRHALQKIISSLFEIVGELTMAEIAEKQEKYKQKQEAYKRRLTLVNKKKDRRSSRRRSET